MDCPLLSIVIANYNYGRFIEAAIRSVLSQDLAEEVELIVCDAASTDDSVEIIKKYADKIAWWCSEKDSGQSEAFNKGFAHAKGRFLTWLNADDVLMPGTVRALYDIAKDRPDIHWVTGNLMKFEQHNGKILEAPWGPHWVPRWAQGSGYVLSVFGPTTFWSREAYKKVGNIDEALHYVMDTDYWMRLLNAGYRYVRLNRVCWGFRLHEVSKTAIYTDHEPSPEVRAKMDAERKKIYLKNRFHITKWGRLANFALRIFDGSRFIDVYRRTFVQGKPFPAKY